jgi:hypothetical protein
MTITMPVRPHPATHPRLTPSELATLQLSAIEHWTADRAARVADLQRPRGRSREQQMEANRQLQVLNAVDTGLVAVLDEHLARAGAPLLARGQIRLVVLHRNDWFVGKLTDALDGAGVAMTARPSSGAATLGATIAEQPDLLLIEDTTSMLPALEIVREVRTFAPRTHVVVQVADGSRAGEFLDAGVSAVVHRCLPPADVAAQLVGLTAPV